MRFTKKDLEIFTVNGFADRMQLIADNIRPKLAKLGELLQPQLSRLVNHQLFPHVAQHARRTIHPPDETWVAFGPDDRGYKNFVHFGLCVSALGVQARVLGKQECKSRKELAINIRANQSKLCELKGNREMEDYSRRDVDFKPSVINDWSAFLTDACDRLTHTQTSVFDVGINLPLSGDLSSHAIQAMGRLAPFYILSGNTNVRPLTF